MFHTPCNMGYSEPNYKQHKAPLCTSISHFSVLLKLSKLKLLVKFSTRNTWHSETRKYQKSPSCIKKQMLHRLNYAELLYLAFSFGVRVTSPSDAMSISQCSGWIPMPKSCISWEVSAPTRVWSCITDRYYEKKSVRVKTVINLHNSDAIWQLKYYKYDYCFIQDFISAVLFQRA